VVRVHSGSPHFFGPLAQLVEHLTLNQLVPGSSPGWLTSIREDRLNKPVFFVAFGLTTLAFAVKVAPKPASKK
jgi:hypothetical protein